MRDVPHGSVSVRTSPTCGKSVSGLIFSILGLLLVAVIVYSVFLGQAGPAFQEAKESAAMQATRTIALAMFQYANDHNGNYPVGASSTEVFQKLIDGNYISDPVTFYVPMSGKTKPDSTHLKAENVSYDVTVPVDSHCPDGLPLVFLTGYRIEYEPDGSAVPLSLIAHPLPGIAACYVSNNANFISANASDSSLKIEHFLPPDFDPKGRHFTQLTPDGPLPPR